MPDLEDRLKAMIAADGPMPVSAFMNACLHDPELGYYATRPGIGRDFITAPEISQVFGELIGLWAAHEWQALGTPDPVQLAEIGPGRGTLMSDMLRASASVEGFVAARSLSLIEASPSLQAVISERLRDTSGSVDFCPSVEALPAGPALIIANEWLDCLPVRQFAREAGQWRERVVGVREDRLSFGLTAPLSERESPANTPDRLSDGEGVVIELQPGLERLADTLAARLAAAPGRALFIDYGPSGEERRGGDTLRAFRDGAQVSPLEAPGESDLTVDVDFDRLAQLARTRGLDVAGPVEQGAFLMALGAQARLDALIEAAPDRAEALHDGVRRLVDPAEMGTRFKVICLSSPGLPPPAGF